MDLPKIEPIVWEKHKPPESVPVKTVPATSEMQPQPDPLPHGKNCYSTFTESEETAILDEVSRLLTDAGISFSRSGTEILCSPNDLPTSEKIFRAVLYSN